MQTEVGKVLKFHETTKSPVNFFYSGKKDYASKVLEILRKSDRPLNITELRRLVGIHCWTTAKSVVMDLVLSGHVEVFKSGRHFFFRLKK